MENLVKKSFPVTGMSCASCALTVENILKKQEGVRDASANYALNQVWVEFDPGMAGTGAFQSALHSSGYDLLGEDVKQVEIEKIREDEINSLKNDTLMAALLALPVVVISMFFPGIPYAGWIMLALSTPVTFWFGRRFFIIAFSQIRNGHTNMDTLVALSTGIAWMFSLFNLLFPRYFDAHAQHHQLYFEASAVIIVFILLGRYLEEKAKSGTTNAIKKLMHLQPEEAFLLRSDDQEVRVPVEWVGVDDRLRIKPGDRIPVDGVVVSGSSFVDESTITGESLPVEKLAGETIYAGTFNQKGSFVMAARKVGKETLLSRIIQTVREAQENKPPVQKMVDKVAAVFVPAVLGIALLTFILWLILGGPGSLHLAIRSLVSVLIIACPCALGLATPTAIMVGIGRGASHGILVRDAGGLEKSCKIDTVVLDKTGTVTAGKPEVTNLIWKTGTPEFPGILLGTEQLSEHPLAEAVVSRLKKDGITAVIPEEFGSHPGKGVTAVSQGIRFAVGNRDLMTDLGIMPDPESDHVATKLLQEAKSVIYFSGDHRLLAIIAIADRVKDSSAMAVDKLKKRGIEVHLLTGDHAITAGAVAAQCGISVFRAECLPEDKAAYITELKNSGKVVGMVGDGVNDSQALALADVSFAMGSGSDISMDVSDMTIVTSDLNAIPDAIRLSRLTVATIRQNLFWAFFYNLIAIPLAAGLFYPLWGFMLNPMIAGAAMAMSSVSVVTNSLRLNYRSMK